MVIPELGRLHELGIDAAIGAVPTVPRLDVLEKIGAEVSPVADAL